MAELLGLPSAASFHQRFTEPLPGIAAGGRRLRAVPGSGRCPLLASDGRCSVFEARPVACRTYPFWPENLASPYEWAREASLCEGIGSPWDKEAAQQQVQPPLVPGSAVEAELLLEELREERVMAEEGWTHSEASAHIAALREVGEDLSPEPRPLPRRVLLHEGGLVVLETPGVDGEDGSDGGWVTRSLHFESSIGVVQTEMRYHPGRNIFDHSTLAFAVHRAMRALLASLVQTGGVDLTAGAAVLGGGGGALPAGLLAAAAEGEMLSGLGPVAVVERDAGVAEAARKYFGFSEDEVGINAGAKLFIQDAVEFTSQPRQGASHAFAAILVDVAGAASHHSSGAVLAPPSELLASRFVQSAISAVRAARGAVAWNVILGAGDDGSGLRACAEAVAAHAGGFSISAVGPMMHDDGTTQWLLVASADSSPMEGGQDFLEAEGLAWLPGARLLD